VTLVENIGVVVRQLLARGDIADGLDPDPAVVDHRIAVGIARVIYESRIVATHGGVDDDIIVDRKKISMVTLSRVVRVPLIRLRGCKPLTAVFD